MKSNNKSGIRGVWRTVLAVLITLLTGSVFKADAFQHPGVPLTVADLDNVKSNLNNAPWSSGYAALAGDSRSQLSYTMQGPFGYVNRNNGGNYDNENQWKNDMQAIFNLARMWYFTGNTNYAQKAHDILLAWANTMTNFGGIESSLDLGDYAYRYGGGADILRGTWPGWTAADTLTVSNFFANVYWPATGNQGQTKGPSNKGALQLSGGLAVAIFNDDTNKFNFILNLYRSSASCGLDNNCLSSGEMGETGRDQGHAYDDLLQMAFMAEVFWKQGVNVYSAWDNRLLACGEYYGRNNLSPAAAYITYGTTDSLYWNNSTNAGGSSAGGVYASEPMMGNILRSAYAVRKGLTTPWMVLKRATQSENEDSFCYLKTADTSTAVPLADLSYYAPVPTVTTGFLNTDIGTATPAGSGSYSGGVWTVAGGGSEIWTTGADSCHFTYQQLTGDFTIIAKVNSVQATAGTAKAGLMIRDSLSSTAANRAWVAVTAAQTAEGYLVGNVDCYGGWSAISRGVPQSVYWVKIQRYGQFINLYTSLDGTSWACITAGYFWNMPATAYVGMVVCSLNNGTLNTSTFSNVSITGGDGGNVTIPPAPYAIYASPDALRVPLRWLQSFGATSYNVLRSSTSGGPYTTIASGLTNASYVDTNVISSATYYYVVTASNAAGTSGNSMEDSATTQSPPAPPTGLNAFAGNAQATLEWLPSSGATSYNVKRSTTSGGGYTTITNVTGTSCFDTRLANGTTYYYVVSAVSAAGEGSNSSEVSVTPNASAAALLWSGAVNGTWDTSTANWLNGGSSATFTDGNTAIFDDSAAANTSISLSANRSPGTVFFNNTSKNYSFSGSAIAGTGSLTKQGSGSLTLNSANTYSGVTTDNGGTIYLGNGSALGTGAVTLNGGALLNTGSADITVGNNIIVGNSGGTITLGVAHNFSLTGALSGSGNLTLGGQNPLSSLNLYFSANTISGTITIPNSSGVNQTVTRFKTTTSGSATAAWSIGGAQDRGTSLDFGTGTIEFGSLSGSGVLQGNSTGVHTLSVGALNTSTTFSGVIKDISGTVALTKVGTGTLTLTGANTYTGGTAVNAGSLVISSVSAANGGYTVANGATLAVNNVSSGSATAGSLTLAAGSTLAFQNVSSTNTPLLAAGSVTVNGSCTVNISGAAPTIGNTYPLLSYSGALSGFANLQVQMPSGLVGTLATNATQITLSVAALPIPVAPAALTANAGNASVALAWSASSGATSYNVKRATVNGGPYTTITNVTTTAFTDTGLVNGTTYYYVVSALNFSGESGNSTQASATPLPMPSAPATLSASVNNGQVLLNWSASAYASGYNVKRSTTSGSGYALIGSASGTSFTDTGVALNQTYYYVVTATNVMGESGNSPEASATPQLTATWTGAANANWDFATANWSGGGSPVVYQDGATVRFDDTALSNTVITISAAVSPLSMVVSNSTQNYSFAGAAIAGSGSLTKSGSGTLTLSAANAYTGGTTNNGGVIAVGNSAALGTGALTLNGGALKSTAGITVSNNIGIVGSGSVIQLGTTANLALNGALSGSGNLTIAPAGGPLCSIYLNFPANTASGTITIPNSTGNNQTVTRFGAASAGSATAAWVIGGAQDRGTSFDFGTGTIEFGSLSGSGVLQGNSTGVHTLSVGALNTSTTFSGVIKDISGTVALTKVGTGTLTLTGANTYTGGTTVNAGALAISTTSAANGTYTVANGATLTVTNVSSGSAAATGLTLAAGSTLEFQNVASVNTPLIAAGGVAVSGSCTVKITGTNGFVAGNVYPLVNYSGAFTGSFADLQLQLPANVIATLVNNANQIALSVSAIGAPAAPTGLAVAAGNAQVGLSWTASASATSYNVKRATVNGGPYTTIANVATTAFTDTGLVNGTTYYYVVSALNADGEGNNSTQASATPQVPAPAAPTGLAAIAGNQQATLNWSASSGATTYNVKRSFTSGGGYTTVANVSTASYTDTSLVNGTTYYYVVSALNAGGESANSSEITVTPSDLVAYWKFNETSGTVAADSSGNGYNGTLPNGATCIAGVSSNAVDMNGTSQYVSLPSGVVSTLNDFSVAAFVKVDTNATWARIFDFGTGTGTYMFLAPASGGSTVRYAITTSSSGGEQQINSTTVLSAGLWHHVAVTLSGSTGVLYIDGAAVATNSSMTLNPSSLGSTTQNYIGKSQWNDPYLNGSVDDFRIYGRALSAGEISTLAAAKLPSPWATSDVGAVAATGGADYVNGQFTLQGSGANIGGAADAFRFVYQPSSGDCSNTVRVTSVPATGANAKAGVMIRETLSAGSLEAGIWVTPTNGIIFTSRNSTGGSTSTSTATGLTAPYWVRIVRVGNSFTAYYSANGTTWTRLGNAKNITMSSSANIGMGVCSGVSNVLNTATMTNALTIP